MLSDSSGLCLLNAFETKQSYDQTLTFNSNIPALSTFPKFLTDTSNNYNSLLFNLATLRCLHKAYTACFSIKWTTTGISSLLLVCSVLFVLSSLFLPHLSFGATAEFISLRSPSPLSLSTWSNSSTNSISCIILNQLCIAYILCQDFSSTLPCT